ncbi:MAG: TadE family protein [bacterium]|nr:TadE family protein [bacterium]
MRRLFSRPFAKGTTAIEFVVVIPLLTLILFGITEFGILFNNWQTETDAAREGARNQALIKSNQMQTEIEVAIDAGKPLETGEVDSVKDVRFLKPLIKVEAFSNPNAWQHTLSLLPDDGTKEEAARLINLIYFTSQDAQLVLSGETQGEDCSDQVDNDNDGKIDCRDEDCFNDPYCNPIEGP